MQVKKKKKKRIINKFLTIFLLIGMLLFFACVFYLNVLPSIYALIILLVTCLILIGIILLNFNRRRIWRLLGYLCSIALITGSFFGDAYLYNTFGFLKSITNGDFDLKTYNVLVLNDSKYQDIADLDGKSIGVNGISLDENLVDAQDNLKKKIKTSWEDYADTEELVSSLKSEEVEGIILENSELDLLKENANEDYNNLKNIYQIEIKNDIKNLEEAVNINKEPFNVYISGIDTFGKISQTSRSDVNILVTVNPKSEKVLITWIPRDYYININKSDVKDKLTHAGIYGVNTSIYAIENLLDVDINYYIKVNFSSVIKAVDLFGGVTVYNDENFTSEDNYYYKKGEITLDGKRALSFVRERHHVTGGDLGRGKNQIKVLEAMINKARSKETLKIYNKLLKTLEGSFVTNASQSVMTSFVKKELQSPRNWQIESNILTGTDAYDYTFSYQKNKLYVMYPDSEAVNMAKEKINSVINSNEK